MRFAKAMIIHHQGAMEMARAYHANADARNGFLGLMNVDITTDQTQEIALMRRAIAADMVSVPSLSRDRRVRAARRCRGARAKACVAGQSSAGRPPGPGRARAALDQAAASRRGGGRAGAVSMPAWWRTRKTERTDGPSDGDT